MTMNHEERGFYILLLCLQWTQGGIAPEDFQRLGKGIAQPSLTHVKTKFKQDKDGCLKNQRLESVRAEQAEFRANRSKSGKVGADKRWHSHSIAIAQPIANDSSPPPTPTPFIPTMELCLKWFADWKKSGADYVEGEMRSAYLALSASGWMWGKNPVTDFRAALERQIQTDRQRNQKPNYANNNRNSSGRPDRNKGTLNEGRSHIYQEFMDKQKAKLAADAKAAA